MNQKTFQLRPVPRGFHLITSIVEKELPEIRTVETGLMHLFLHHTSASLTLNENADPTVRRDLESAFNRIAPEDADYRHNSEGPDDMPAHIKSSVLGASLMIPISGGRLVLGTWQGIYLCEHRDRASARTLTATIMGEVK